MKNRKKKSYCEKDFTPNKRKISSSSSFRHENDHNRLKLLTPKINHKVGKDLASQQAKVGRKRWIVTTLLKGFLIDSPHFKQKEWTMKTKLFILCSLFLVLGLAAGAQAVPFTTYHSGSGDVFVGGFDYNGGGDTATTYYRSYDENTLINPVPASLDANFIIPPPNDTPNNVNALINYYNTEGPGGLPLATDWVDGSLQGVSTFTITWDPWMEYEYLSLKFGNVVDLWNIAGSSSFYFAGLPQNISHYTLWNGKSVPEPSNLLLLGTGLIGLAGLGRKRLLKK